MSWYSTMNYERLLCLFASKKVVVRQISPFNLHDTATKHHGIVLVANTNLFAPFSPTIVIVSSKNLQMLLEGFMLDPPIKIQQLWLIVVDEFTGSKQPII